MEATHRLQRSRLALVTLDHFLHDSDGSFFTPILPLLIAKESAKSRGEPLSDMLRCATLRA